MAIWQYDYYLIPESVIAQRSGLNPVQLTARKFKSLRLSEKPWCPSDYAKSFSELLPEFPAWTPALRWWGTENGNRIDVFRKEPSVDFIRIRFDIRRMDLILMRRLADLAQSWHCVFCSAHDLHIIPPSGPSVLQHISESRRLRFVWQWFGNSRDVVTETRQVFICHSSKDKPFVRRLARDLKASGVQVWFDEWSLSVGDSLSEKIQDGIQKSSWLLVVLSKSSIRSGWVKRELNSGLALELEKKGVFVLPVLKENCQIPLFLKDKVYADFRKPYRIGFETLLRRLAA